MARQARELSLINSYTVVLKAVNGVSFNPVSASLFLKTAKTLSSNLDFKFLAYNISDNIITFVVHNLKPSISLLMRKLVVSFVSKFNLINGREGKVFKERFVSLPAHNEAQVWEMVQSVHSLNDFANSKNNYFKDAYVSSSYALQQFNTKQNFIKKVLNKQATLNLSNFKPKTKIKDEDLVTYINTFIMPIENLNTLNKNVLTSSINQIVKATAASARQISRITSLPLRLLWSCIKIKDIEVNHD